MRAGDALTWAWTLLFGIRMRANLGIIGAFTPKLPDVVLGDSELTRKQRYEMLRRSKILLSMRRADDEIAARLERRKKWNIARLPVIQNNLDLFPAVKYSYSSRRPDKHEINLVVSDGGKVRFDGLVRSDNMRLDPVDAPRIAYKKRKEIQRALQWGYDNGVIPVMLTFTIFHDWTWQPLEKLIFVLRNSYDDMFDHSVGERLRNRIGFKYRIFRMEETIDMKNPLAACDDNGKLNAGVQFQSSTLQEMLALPEGDEDAFIEAQVAAGKPVENQSKREVRESVKQWKEAKSKEVSVTVNNEFNLFTDEFELADQSQSVGKSDSAPIQNPELNLTPTEESVDELTPAEPIKSFTDEENLRVELEKKRAETQKLLDEISMLIQTAADTKLDEINLRCLEIKL